MINTSTVDLVLAPDAPIDLHLHTFYSDGVWSPEALLDHLVSESFALVAITDHDRVDTLPEIQQLAAQKHLPVLVGAEMTTQWHGQMVDVLCYGFSLEGTALARVAHSVFQRQQDNLREAYSYLIAQGFPFPPLEENPELLTVLEKPSAQQPHDFVPLIKNYGVGIEDGSLKKALRESGLALIMTEIASVVEAAHQDGGVCLVAHPGREDITLFDTHMLDELREEIPIDGLEVYYPKHNPQQTTMYGAYAQKHGLLISSGSDSHGPHKMPIKYECGLSRLLLERMGIEVRLKAD